MKLDTNFLYTFFVQKNISLFIQILLYVERKLAVHFVTGYCSFIYSQTRSSVPVANELMNSFMEK